MESGLWDDVRPSGVVIKPQFASDKSYVESAVDFLHDVVPQAVVPQQENRELEEIVWVKFEEADVNDRFTYDNDRSSEQPADAIPLLLCIGYQNGFHVWVIKPSNEAVELLSIRRGPVRLVKLLKSPAADLYSNDKYKDRRPLMAVCDEESTRTPYRAIAIYSLTARDRIRTLDFNTEVYDIVANDRLLIVGLQDKIAAYETTDFESSFTINGYYSSPATTCSIPLAVSNSRWLAYADQQLVRNFQSYGGVLGPETHSYKAVVYNAAKAIGQGLSKIGETVTRFTSAKATRDASNLGSNLHSNSADDCFIRGVVTIIDIKSHQLSQSELNTSKSVNGNGIIAHFLAHVDETINCMSFDASGLLLVTSAEFGRNMHVFRIAPHAHASSLGSVHHLYTLHRGDTPAMVRDITFSVDSRWISICTAHGTTHVFPILPNGGNITWRTHGHPRVVDKNSRFHTSAGLEDISTISHLPKPAPEPDIHYDDDETIKGINKNLTICSNRLLMLSFPVVVEAHAKIKQRLFASFVGNLSGSPTGNNNAGSYSSYSYVPLDTTVSQFSHPRRRWNSYGTDEVKPDALSLYVINDQGKLIEYALEVRPKNGIALSDDAAIEIITQPKMEWCLRRSARWKDLELPLHKSNPLIISSGNCLRLKAELELGPRVNSEVTKMPQPVKNPSDNKTEYGEWLSEVEITTHSSPHRRLWMGPQFHFKVYKNSKTVPVNSNNAATIIPDVMNNPYSPLYLDNSNLKTVQLSPIVRSKPVPTPTGRNRTNANRNSFSSSAGSCDSVSSGSGPQILIDNGPNSYELGFKSLEGYPATLMNVGSPSATENLEETIKQNIANAMNDIVINADKADCQDDVVDDHENVIRGPPPTTLISSSYAGSMDHVAVFPAQPKFE